MATSKKATYSTKSRALFYEGASGDTVDGIYAKSYQGGIQQAMITGELSAELCGITQFAGGAANTLALNAAFARTDVNVIVFNNPKGGAYYFDLAGGANNVEAVVPYGKFLKFRNGNYLSGAGRIVFDQNLPDAGQYKIFQATLSVRMNVGRMSQVKVFPEWWGARSLFQPEKVMTAASLPGAGASNNIDSTTAFQRMFNSIYGFAFYTDPGTVPAKVILSGVYALSDQINLNFFLGEITGYSAVGRSGGGFRWIVNATSNSNKVMFKCHGCEGMKWTGLSFWGYRDDDPAKQLKAIIFPVFDSTVSPGASQRRHIFQDVTFGDATGHYTNTSAEEQAITAQYFAQAAILCLGSEPGSIYINGNNDFFKFRNVNFYNVQIGCWNRQNQAVAWSFKHCQAGRIKWMFQFDYGGGVYVDEFFLEGYAVGKWLFEFVGWNRLLFLRPIRKSKHGRYQRNTFREGFRCLRLGVQGYRYFFLQKCRRYAPDLFAAV